MRPPLKALSGHLATCLFATLTSASIAAPITLGFEGFDNTTGTECVTNDEYAEGGFKVTTRDLPAGALQGRTLCAWYRPASFNMSPGGTALYASYSGSSVVFERVDGGVFSAVSVQVSDIYNAGARSVFNFEFAYQTGATETLQFQLDSFEGAETFTLDKQGLLGLRLWAPGGTVQFDNLGLEAAPRGLPEPGTFWLAGLGLLGVIWKRQCSRTQLVRCSA